MYAYLRFQNTNPERGRKPLIPAPLRIMYALNFRTRTPKGDGNRLIDSAFRGKSRLISEHEPRKGTETRNTGFRRTSIAPHFRTRTPKGDGNAVVAIAVTAASMDANFRTRTPKGDGNKSSRQNPSFTHIISEHEPRKGTETDKPCKSQGGIESHFRTRTPKGDGNSSMVSEDNESFSSLFQNTNPERGRKLRRILYMSAGKISEHEPRKGTETPRLTPITSRPTIFQNTNPERGRKLLAPAAQVTRAM